jgi:hypothetical protein
MIACKDCDYFDRALQQKLLKHRIIIEPPQHCKWPKDQLSSIFGASFKAAIAYSQFFMAF